MAHLGQRYLFAQCEDALGGVGVGGVLPADAGVGEIAGAGELVAWFQVGAALGQVEEGAKGAVVFGVDFHLDRMAVVGLFGVGGDGCREGFALTEKALCGCAGQLLIADTPQEAHAPADGHQEQFRSGASMKDQGQGRQRKRQGGQQEL